MRQLIVDTVVWLMQPEVYIVLRSSNLLRYNTAYAAIRHVDSYKSGLQEGYIILDTVYLSTYSTAYAAMRSAIYSFLTLSEGHIIPSAIQIVKLNNSYAATRHDFRHLLVLLAWYIWRYWDFTSKVEAYVNLDTIYLWSFSTTYVATPHVFWKQLIWDVWRSCVAIL